MCGMSNPHQRTIPGARWRTLLAVGTAWFRITLGRLSTLRRDMQTGQRKSLKTTFRASLRSLKMSSWAWVRLFWVLLFLISINLSFFSTLEGYETKACKHTSCYLVLSTAQRLDLSRWYALSTIITLISGHSLSVILLEVYWNRYEYHLLAIQ